MTIIDKVVQQDEGEGMLDGRGRYRAYLFFEGLIDPAEFLADLRCDPGAYAGYPSHAGHDSILYVLSGLGEHYQDGERCTLKPGDCVLVPSGTIHALKSIGYEDLRILEFAAVPAKEGLPRSSATQLPLPEAISGW
jgi:mannose-6-phosphate isomerase-like protein (cupin superfamily)